MGKKVYNMFSCTTVGAATANVTFSCSLPPVLSNSNKLNLEVNRMAEMHADLDRNVLIGQETIDSQEIREQHIDASNDPEGDITIDTGLDCARMTVKYGKMLLEINVINKVLQTRGYVFSLYRSELDALIESAEDENNYLRSAFFCVQAWN
eukprot:IDg10204t1